MHIYKKSEKQEREVADLIFIEWAGGSQTYIISGSFVAIVCINKF